MRRLAPFAVAFGLIASACSPASDTAPSAAEEVTDIPETAIKRQRIGNCWIYTAVGWVESLAHGTGAASNVS